MPTSLKKATVETMSITPRRDGKVEIVLRVLAQHDRLVECAASFIKAGVTSFQLLDVFKRIAPAEDDAPTASEIASDVGPTVTTLHSESGVQRLAPVDVSDLGDVNGERPLANDNAAHEPRLPANLACFLCAHAASCDDYVAVKVDDEVAA